MELAAAVCCYTIVLCAMHSGRYCMLVRRPQTVKFLTTCINMYKHQQTAHTVFAFQNHSYSANSVCGWVMLCSLQNSLEHVQLKLQTDSKIAQKHTEDISQRCFLTTSTLTLCRSVHTASQIAFSFSSSIFFSCWSWCARYRLCCSTLHPTWLANPPRTLDTIYGTTKRHVTMCIRTRVDHVFSH